MANVVDERAGTAEPARVWDVLVVGGDAAGLSAALTPVRARRGNASDPIAGVVQSAAAGVTAAAAVNHDLVAADAAEAVTASRTRAPRRGRAPLQPEPAGRGRFSAATEAENCIQVFGDRRDGRQMICAPFVTADSAQRSRRLQMNMSADTSDPASVSEEFWETHYRQHQGVGTGRVNPILAEVGEALTPGAALDLGCGEGNDTVWLARRGWQVTAVDVSATVLDRAAAQATAAGVRDRVEYARHDLTVTFPAGHFDLVSAQYLHSPVAFSRQHVLRSAANAVRPGGVFLVVDHGSVPPWSWADPDTRFPTPEQALADLGLDMDRWTILRVDAPQRSASGPSGQNATVTDTVIAFSRRTG